MIGQLFYADAKEELPPSMPEARGNPVQINCFTNADHAGILKHRIQLNLQPLALSL